MVYPKSTLTRPAPAEGKELVHYMRNIAMALRFGQSALNDAYLARNDEHFQRIHSAMHEQTQMLTAAIAQAAKLLEPAATEPVSTD